MFISNKIVLLLLLLLLLLMGFSLKVHYIHLFKCIKVLHINRKKYYYIKLLETKFLAVFANPKKFPGGTGDGLPCLFPLCAGGYGNVTF